MQKLEDALKRILAWLKKEASVATITAEFNQTFNATIAKFKAREAAARELADKAKAEAEKHLAALADHQTEAEAASAAAAKVSTLVL